jgi:NADH pyrophosphatase NudC (nudix superfamily)
LDEIQKAQPTAVKETVRSIIAETPINAPSDEDLEDLISRRRTIRQQKTAGFCPNCGKPIFQSDQFCPSCGQILSSK